MGRHVSIQCNNTPALCYDASITWVDKSMFSTVPYLRVPIVLLPSHSLLLVYTNKHLYDKNMNNEQESINNQLYFVLYCTYRYPLYKIYVLNSYGRYENPVIRIMLYENSVIRISLYVNSDICIMLYVSCNCGPLQVVISVI